MYARAFGPPAIASHKFLLSWHLLQEGVFGYFFLGAEVGLACCLGAAASGNFYASPILIRNLSHYKDHLRRRLGTTICFLFSVLLHENCIHTDEMASVTKRTTHTYTHLLPLSPPPPSFFDVTALSPCFGRLLYSRCQAVAC
jgi:hypothetical protein